MKKNQAKLDFHPMQQKFSLVIGTLLLFIFSNNSAQCSLQVFAGNDTTINAGATIILQATDTGGAAPVSFLWSGNLGAGSAKQVTPCQTTAYICYGFDNGNCSDTDTVIVNVIPPVVHAGNDTSLCLDQNIFKLKGSPSGGRWSGFAVKGDTFQVRVAGAGTFKVLYIIDLGPCTYYDSITISVNAIPGVDVSSTINQACLNSAAINLFGSPWGGVFSGTAVVDSTFVPSVAGIGRHKITYTYTSASGCINVDSTFILVNAPETADAGNDFRVCANSGAIALNGRPAGGNWRGPGISGITFDPVNAGPGIHKLVYTYNSGACGLVTDSILATVIALPQPSFTATPLAGQAPLNVSFNNTSTGTYNFSSWDFGDPASGALNSSMQTNPTHMYNNMGTYSVSVTIKDTSTAGCESGLTRSNLIFVGSIGFATNDFFQWSLYPNPASDFLTIEILEPKGFTFSLLGLDGKEYLGLNLVEKNNVIDIHQIPSGLYLFRIYTQAGEASFGKIIIQ